MAVTRGRSSNLGRLLARVRTWRAGLVVLFAAALAWRLLYLGRLAATPLSGSLTMDARSYWTWAQRLLESGPVGTEPFFLGPLYPYTLALLSLITGDSIERVLWIQACWGSAAVVLLTDAARRVTGRAAAGIAVGTIACFYEMAVFFDGLVLMESLLFFIESLLLWFVVRLEWSVAKARHWLLLGAGIGLLAAGRASHAALLIPVSIWLVDWRRNGLRDGVRRLGQLLLGFGVIVSPITIHNRMVAGEWIPFTYNGGYNLYVGNHPGATGGSAWITGTHVPLAEAQGVTDGRAYLRETQGLTLSPGASSRYWAGRALEYWRANPVEALRLSGRKLKMIWNRHEYAQIENADQYRSLAGPLGIPIVGTFALLGPLAIAGVAFSRSAGRSGLALTAYVVTVTLSIVPFFVTDRFRHHLVPAALLLAGVALIRIWQAFAEGRARLAAVAALAGGVALVNLPAPQQARGAYEWALAADIGSRLLEQGRPDLAIQEFEKAATLARRARVEDRAGLEAAVELGAFYHNFGLAHDRLGHAEEAIPWYARAVDAAPDNAVFVRTLADRYELQGRAPEAEVLYARLPGLVGGEGQLQSARGWQAARKGRLDDAARAFELAVASEPRLFEAWGALVRIQVQMNDVTAAAASLERARLAGLAPHSLWAHRALIAAVSGDGAAAKRALSRVPDDLVARDASLREVVAVVRRLVPE